MSRNESIVLSADVDVRYNRHVFPSKICIHESQVYRTENYERNLNKSFYFETADELTQCTLSNRIWRRAQKLHMT